MTGQNLVDTLHIIDYDRFTQCMVDLTIPYFIYNNNHNQSICTIKGGSIDTYTQHGTSLGSLRSNYMQRFVLKVLCCRTSNKQQNMCTFVGYPRFVLPSMVQYPNPTYMCALLIEYSFSCICTQYIYQERVNVHKPIGSLLKSTYSSIHEQ